VTLGKTKKDKIGVEGFWVKVLTVASELSFRSPKQEEDVNITLDLIFLAIFQNQNSLA
jgi:hypothetical protein